MGQLIDEDECEVCEPFDQEWIFTYGDLVTLLLCFFILLFSMCKLDVEKIKAVSMSFKPNPPGTPFLFQGKQSVLSEVSKEVEKLDMPDDVTVNNSDKGVEVSFQEHVLFDNDSTDLTPEARATLQKALTMLISMTQDILIEGHTDSQYDQNSEYPSNWEFSVARATTVANYLEQNGVPSKRMQVAGYAGYRPRFYNDTAYKRRMNRRVTITILPDEVTR